MSLTPTSSLLLLLLQVLVALTVTAEYPYSVHDVLRSHGLPAGLFPKSVKSYTLDHTGFLEVHLDRPCLAQYETRVFFDSVVRTYLSFGQLKVLEGMSQEELFLWLPVKDIIVTDPSSGLIVIDIGLAYKHLSLSRFDNPPICRSQGLKLQIGGRKGLDSKYRDEKLFVYVKGWLLLCWSFSILVSLFWGGFPPKKELCGEMCNPKI